MPLISAALLKNALVKKIAELEQGVSTSGINQLRQVVERTEKFLPSYADDEELLAALNKARITLLTFDAAGTSPGFTTPTVPPTITCPPGQEPQYMAARCHGCGSWQCAPKLPVWSSTMLSRNAQAALLKLHEAMEQFRTMWCPGCSRPSDDVLRAALNQAKNLEPQMAQAGLAQDYAAAVQRAEYLLNLEPWTPGTTISTTVTVPEGQVVRGQRPFYKHPLFLVGVGVAGAYVLIKVIK